MSLLDRALGAAPLAPAPHSFALQRDPRFCRRCEVSWSALVDGCRCWCCGRRGVAGGFLEVVAAATTVPDTLGTSWFDGVTPSAYGAGRREL